MNTKHKTVAQEQRAHTPRLYDASSLSCAGSVTRSAAGDWAKLLVSYT